MAHLDHMIQASQSTGPAVWYPAHLSWLANPGPYSEAAIEHSIKSYRGLDIPQRIGEQKHRFSASSVTGEHGTGFACHRAMLFKYAGVQQLPPTQEQRDNMDQGSALHLHYQMEGLSAGYLISAETWDYDIAVEYGMKDDGVQYDNSLLELKFVHAKKFRKLIEGDRWTKTAPGAFEDNLMQVTGGMWLKGYTVASLVYGNKEAGQFLEFRVELEDQRVKLLERILSDLAGWVELNELPPMREDCAQNRGWLSEHCEYRLHCPKATKVFAQLEEA